MADFEKRHAAGPAIRGVLCAPAEPFSVTVLFGPSGCGKTTVLRSLAGLERPERGRIACGAEIWLDASAGTCWPPQRRGVGFVFQEPALFPHLSVEENVGFGLRGLSAAERARRAGDLLELLDLPGLGGRRPRDLSGGEAQRVALARALAPRPRWLLLDEPLSSLDTPTREQLRPRLRRWLARAAIPTILVTHDRGEVLALGDRVCVMDGGAPLQEGAIAEVFGRPRSVTVARITGTENVLEGKVGEIRGGLATVFVGSTAVTALAPEPAAEHVFVCLRGEDVTLEREARAGTSARNHLAATVLAIEPEGALARVVLDAGFPLAALVTRASVEDLALGAGVRVVAAIKVAALQLVPRD